MTIKKYYDVIIRDGSGGGSVDLNLRESYDVTCKALKDMTAFLEEEKVWSKRLAAQLERQRQTVVFNEKEEIADWVTENSMTLLTDYNNIKDVK